MLALKTSPFTLVVLVEPAERKWLQPIRLTANADLVPGAATLFYMNNVLHDYLYEIGFTERFWNFQMDNFGEGGAGGDSVSAQV